MTAKLHQHITWREIHAQPAIWRSWAERLDVAALRAWIDAQDAAEIWFCGAGSSAYIGDIVVSALEGSASRRLRAVPTTDLVSRPAAFLKDRNPLVVSIGRSGNSTETIGTLDALDVLAPRAPRINITCNSKGALANRTSTANQKVIVLPEATHDAGFAMTSSFTTMLLTALALFDTSVSPADVPMRLSSLADDLERLLPEFLRHAMSARRPDRAVFVGTGPLGFAAREAALKVLELSAGQIPALWDTTLGFRHGPKSFVQGATDIWVFQSADPYAALYDADLTRELRKQFPESVVTSVGPQGDIDVPTDTWGCVLAVGLAQVLSVVWSDALGLGVDDPFSGQGTLSRVVTGVTLYPMRQK